MLTPQWDAGFVALSFLVSALGADTSLFMIDMARAQRKKVKTRHGQAGVSVPWVFLAAVALGGCGIWCMHFTGE